MKEGIVKYIKTIKETLIPKIVCIKKGISRSTI
jgi:hypothetical protein